MKVHSPKGAVALQRYVVLDLDSTLVWARKADLNKCSTDDERNFWVKPIDIEFFRVTIRKHLDVFLDQLYAKGYKIVIWSAGGGAYVKDIISVIFKGRNVEYLFTNEHLNEKGLKDLNIIKAFIPGFTLENARLVDDNPDHKKGQETSCIIIKPFEFKGGHPSPAEDDDDLLTMAERIDSSFS
jgi:hypothetical protein